MAGDLVPVQVINKLVDFEGMRASQEDTYYALMDRIGGAHGLADIIYQGFTDEANPPHIRLRYLEVVCRLQDRVQDRGINDADLRIVSDQEIVRQLSSKAKMLGLRVMVDNETANDPLPLMPEVAADEP